MEWCRRQRKCFKHANKLVVSHEWRLLRSIDDPKMTPHPASFCDMVVNTYYCRKMWLLRV